MCRVFKADFAFVLARLIAVKWGLGAKLNHSPLGFLRQGNGGKYTLEGGKHFGGEEASATSCIPYFQMAENMLSASSVLYVVPILLISPSEDFKAVNYLQNLELTSPLSDPKRHQHLALDKIFCNHEA